MYVRSSTFPPSTYYQFDIYAIVERMQKLNKLHRGESRPEKLSNLAINLTYGDLTYQGLICLIHFVLFLLEECVQ